MTSYTIIKNVSQLVDFRVREKMAMIFQGEDVVWVGPEKEIPSDYPIEQEVDAEGRLVTAGLVDCHTHLVFAGSRSEEFFKRLQGTSYEDIARSGGGIASTVKSTREASDDVLKDLLRKRLDSFLSYGVTTLEVKSGYGLRTEDELRILKIANEMDHPVEIVPTFLGAHVVPPEFEGKRDAYIELVCEEMMPKVKEQNLSNICDVFCDEGAFTVEETRKILARAKGLGFNVKLHADQLKGTGAAELAAEFGALSADHLEQISEAGISSLAKSGTIAVLIPGSVFFLGKRSYAPARKLIEKNVNVAISTDCNPGTSLSENLPLMMSFAAVEMKMSVQEIWAGVTTFPAQAMGLKDRGRFAPGMAADFVVWDAENWEEVPYHYGSVKAHAVYKKGRRVYAA